MTLLKKTTITGAWFGLGVLLTIGLVLLHLHVPMVHASLFSICLSLGVGGIVGTYCGQVWGVKILNLGAKKTSEIGKAIGYGLLIGFVTFYIIIFSMTLVSYFQTKFGDLWQQAAYTKIIMSLLKTPALALFGTLMGCILEPLVLFMSALGGCLLYLLRQQILRLSQE